MDTEFRKNKNKVLIRKCCGSCKFKATDEKGKCRCTAINRHVESGDSSCQFWVMSSKASALELKDQNGRIKRKEYLIYLVRCMEEEIQAGRKKVGMKNLPSIAELRRRWERITHKSVYDTNF